MDTSVNAVDEAEQLTVATQRAKSKADSRCVHETIMALFICSFYRATLC